MKRHQLIFVVTLVALIGSFVSAFGAQQERDWQLRGYVDASQDANLPFRVPRLGVNTELSQYSMEGLPKQLELMQEAQVTWVRQVFPWDEIEPNPNQLVWDKWDQIVKTMDNYPALRLIAVLMYSPAWARSEQSLEDRTSPPVNPTEFAKFGSLFAARYGRVIDYYQVWDEPNLTASWGGLEPRAADYAALLREAHAAIHSADGSATVIVGALAPTTEIGPKNISDIVFLHDLYALEMQPYIDAVGAKPYGFDLSPNDRTISPNTLNFSRIIALREEMVKNQDGKKAVWAMNWGWNSLPENWEGQPSIWGQVSSETQVAYSLGALDRAEREWPWLAGMILQHWQPLASAGDPIWGFALINQKDQPSPLYDALTKRSRPVAAENGLYPATTPHARYSGVWTFGSMGADIGWVQDSQLDFEFLGQAVSLLLRQDNYVGYLYPSIDGQRPNATPHDASGNAYIVLTSGSLEPEVKLVPVATGLPENQHTLHVIADRGWDRWAVAGFGVNSQDLATPYNSQVLVAWIAVAISFTSVLVAGWQAKWKIIPNPLTALNRQMGNISKIVVGAIASLTLMTGMLLTWGDNTPHILKREPVQLGLAIISAGIIYLEPNFILVSLAAMALFVLIYNQLELGLTLVIFWSPFFLFPVELYRFAFPMAEILILITGGAWLLHSLVDIGKRRQSAVSQFKFSPLSYLTKLNALDFCILAFVILGIVSLSWAELKSPALTELRVLILEPALFYCIFRSVPMRQKTAVRLVDALLLAGSMVAAIGLFQFLQGDAVITAEAGARRLASVYGSPNNVGLLLGRCIPFALAFALLPIDPKRRIVATVLLLMMGLAVVLSQSVGAIFIGVPSAVLAVLLLTRRKYARVILVSVLVIVAIGFLFSLQSERFARVLVFDSGTNFYRIRVWQSAINVIQDYPATGLGLDQFLYAFRGRYIMPDAWQERDLSHPHNIILDFWVRLGVSGITLFFVIEVFFWKYVRKAVVVHHAEKPISYAITVGIMGSMINLLSHGLIDNSVFVQDLVYVFILMMGLAVYLANISAIDEPDL